MLTSYKRILMLSLCAAAFVIVLCAQPVGNASAQRKTKLLFVTECKGFRHAVLHQAEEIMEQLGAKNGWDVDITQMAEVKLTPQELKNLADDPKYAATVAEMKALLKKVHPAPLQGGKAAGGKEAKE